MATLICAQCRGPVSRSEVTCPTCGALVIGGDNTVEVDEQPDVEPKPEPESEGSAVGRPTEGSPEVPVCPHCGAMPTDPSALVCLSCLRELRPVRRPTDGPVPDAPSDEGKARTRRDRAITAIVLEVAGESVNLVPNQRILIGRDLSSPAGRLLSRYDNVSRTHAVISLDHGQLWISDLDSTNGSYLEGRRLSPGERAPLVDGARLRLASNVEAVIRLEIGE